MEKNSKVGPQVLAAFAATIGAFVLGCALGWSSPAFSSIKCPETEDNSTITTTIAPSTTTVNTDLAALYDLTGDETTPAKSLVKCVDDDEGKWIGGLLCIGALLASQVVGLIMIPKMGPKWSMISMSIPAIIGWVLLMLPYALDDGEMETVWLFYLGRIFTGFGGGAFSLAAPMFVSEIAETRIKGALGAMMQFQVTIGILFVSALNIENAVDWLTITGICIAPPILMVLALFFVPDSPVFLVRKGDEDAARKSLRWLRGSEYTGVEDEISAIQEAEREQNAPESKVSLKEIFSQGVYLKPFGISLALMFFQQFSGINQVLFYMTDIFKAAGSDMNPGTSNFMVNCMQVLATGLAVVIVDKLGRKILLVVSGVTMCATIIVLGVYFYLDEQDEDVSSIGWLPLVCLIIYILGFSIGFGPLPWSMNAELFPKEAQGVMSSMATLFNWGCSFIVSTFSQDVGTVIHDSGLYFLFGSFCALGVVFVLLICPETKGKTQEDMKKYFSGEKK